jgi:hypothetical protein
MGGNSSQEGGLFSQLTGIVRRNNLNNMEHMYAGKSIGQSSTLFHE